MAELPPTLPGRPAPHQPPAWPAPAGPWPGSPSAVQPGAQHAGQPAAQDPWSGPGPWTTAHPPVPPGHHGGPVPPGHPGGPVPPGHPGGPVPPGRNGLSVAALVLGVAGFAVLTGMAAIGLGIAALAQIRATGQRGRGAAVAGIVTGAVWLPVVAVAVIVAAATSAPPRAGGPADTPVSASPSAPAAGTPAPGATQAPRLADSSDVAVGTCLQTFTKDTPDGELPVVPCGQPHVAEVYGTFDLPGASWPGEGRVDEWAEDGCDERWPQYTRYEQSEVKEFYYSPTRDTWNDDDRKVTCVAVFPKPRRGSISR